jgi:hypothetical protein
MARNRVIYQSEALYVSNGVGVTTSGQHAQLERVQSANYNFSISRQDINQYGQLGRLDSIVLEAPTVALDFSYYLTDGFNERALGFYVTTTSSTASGNFPSGHMTTSSGQNFFITTVAEGLDATGVTGIASTIGIGNAFLTNYGLELAVGSIPTVSVSMEAANINSDRSFSTSAGGITGVANPGVNPTDGLKLTTDISLKPATTGASAITALRPGDITISLDSFDGTGVADLGSDSDALHIQSASLSIPLSRSPLQRLGSRFPFARTVDFPIKATLSISAIVNETKATNLSDIINATAGNLEKDVTMTLKGQDSVNKMIFILKGCTIDSESFSSSIGSNKTVELTFSTQIGGPNDTTHGILVSGANTTTTFL